MKQEQKIYIELYVEKIVSMTVEAGYNVDKFGNIIYEDKTRTIEQLQKILDGVVNNTNLDIEEILDYLIEVYNKKINMSDSFQEWREIKSLLTTIKDMHEDEKETDTNKNNNSTNIEKTR